MPFVKANPNQYLLVGRGGTLENRGSAIQVFLMPGTVYALVPSTKQEATFQFTQETRDGIPLRFKGIVIYRVSDPTAAARHFDFADGDGVAQISAMLTDVCLGELRHAVSHMTMAECIEQRKTTLSGVIRAAVEQTVLADGGMPWGISVEVSQLSQVFIVDGELRRQLEAEIRNEIKLRSDQSDIRTAEEARLASMASDTRVAEQKLAADREAVRQEEALEVARAESRRRLSAEDLTTERQALELAQDLHRSEMETEEAKINAESPVRLLRITRERDVLGEELAMRELRRQVRALEVEHDLLLPRAEQELRRELLPLEQAPEIVASAAKLLQGANLSIYGDEARWAGSLAPILDLLARAVERATGGEGVDPTAGN